MFNEFHSLLILFIEVKYFLISSNIYFPDLRFSDASPIITNGLCDFSIFADNSCFPSIICLTISVLLDRTLYGYVRSPTSPKE